MKNEHEHWAIKMDADYLAAFERKIATPPTILSKTAGRQSCSIFRLPKSFIDVYGNLCQPQLVSIGPLHHGQAHLHMMEEHKYHYLGQLLARTSLLLSALFQAVLPLEGVARESYSETIGLGTAELVEMMVVDGCFVIELFRKVAKRVQFEPDDPIVSMSWIFPALLRDLQRLENQIPYFVLQRLFDLTTMDEVKNGGPNLAILGLEFFNFALQRPNKILSKYKDLQPKHLLDLLRSSFITPELDTIVPSSKEKPTHLPLSISKLWLAGIHLRPGESETFLQVKFRRGIIEMPTVTFDDFMSSLIRNCVAYEQCHKNCSTFFTTYATLVYCLVNTAQDAEYLCDKGIIENYFGTSSEIATFINNTGKDVAFDIGQCYLAEFFSDVNAYYNYSWHVYWKTFYTYFVLLVLTILQTLYTVISYYK